MSRATIVVTALALFSTPHLARAQTISDVVASHSGGCTTAGGEGLSDQLVRTQLCMFPGGVTEFAPYAGITLTSSRVHALSAVETATALHHAADAGPLEVNSAFRTLSEQYLLYTEGGCGLAATPGTSNHESGVAVDLSNWSAALTRMTDAGCTHPYPTSDAVHFDCPGPDMRAASIMVFQHLWNVNNPGDPIAEDGVYGPMTGARLGRSPADGFAMDGCSVTPPRQWGATFVSQSFPIAADPPLVMHPGEEVMAFIELSNSGTETWDASTRLATTGPRDRASAFVAADWINAGRPAGVTGTVAPGGSHRFAFTLHAPDAVGEYDEHFGVVQEGVAWFSDPGELGPPDELLELRVSVVAAAIDDAGTSSGDGGHASGDAGPTPPSDGGVRTTLSEGCACSASGARHARAPWSFFAIALAVALRRACRTRSRAAASPTRSCARACSGDAGGASSSGR